MSDDTSNVPPAAPPQAFWRSVYTSGFPDLLEALGVSVLVSTYQVGMVVALRADGDAINTHFREIRAPMGMAVDGPRLAVGTPTAIWEFRDVPEAARRIDPGGKHDACFLPRSAHVTGNILVHELAFGSGELWLVNTRFSCLCTLDRDSSFVPRWRPPFVTADAPEDRCHLNGLAMVDGRPRFVTAHGRSDEPAGWRRDKARGGVVVDVDSGEVVAPGLAMPHSPRWHDGKLWVLNSGAGTLGVVDLATGRVEPVATLPGFTRGLDFAGPYAFVGLSQVRQSALFSGIPITERPTERQCGVWVVDTRTGRVEAFLRFEDTLQEIFAVLVLPGRRYPEIVTDAEKQPEDAFVFTPSPVGGGRAGEPRK